MLLLFALGISRWNCHKIVLPCDICILITTRPCIREIVLFVFYSHKYSKEQPPDFFILSWHPSCVTNMKNLKHRKNLAEWPSSAKILRLRNICGVDRYYIFLWNSAPPQKIYCSKIFAELSLSHSPDLDRYLKMKLSRDIIAVQCIREIVLSQDGTISQDTSRECYDICIPNRYRERIIILRYYYISEMHARDSIISR